jgi:hypothetical protein
MRVLPIIIRRISTICSICAGSISPSPNRTRSSTSGRNARSPISTRG